VEKNGAAGKEWPSHIHVRGPVPLIEIRNKDVALMSTYGISGAKSTAIGTVYLTKIDNMGVRVVDGTAEHIKITTTSAESRIWVTQHSGDSSEGTINIQPIKDSAAAITISTTSAIT
jgi:hypothetical protein